MVEIDLTRFKLRGIQAKILDGAFFGEPMISVAMGVTDAMGQCKEEAYVHRRQRMPTELLQCNRPALLAWIKSEIMSALEHEIDECLYVDGVRVCADPHPELLK